MEPESILLVAAAILLIIDLIIVGRNKVKLKQSIYGFYACFFSFFLIAITYLSFLADFVTSNFSLIQVYSYTQSSMTLISKTYATWAGSAGSILLLILFTSIAWFSIRLQGYKKQHKTNYSSSLIVGIVVLFFIIASLMMNPFARYGADGPVEGRGLNPALQSVWMAVHPPIVFAGYTFIVVAFSLTLAKMKTGLKSYDRLFSVSVKAGWLFLTLGIGLGGLWAYEVLGWGGYWSWDPIETASLLPWVALTAYFIVHHFSKGRSLTSEFSILLAFFSLMFLSALTRGGLLQSVHAYGLSPAGPFILVFAGLMMGYFFYLKWRAARPLFGLEFSGKPLKSLSMVLALVSLFGIFLVCFSGIVYSMVAQALNVSAFGVNFYNYANFPFVVGLFFALIGYSIHPFVALKRYIILVVGVSVSSVVLFLANWPTGNVLANLGLPLVVLGLCAGAASLLLAIKSLSFQSVARTFVHLGFVVVLLGVFVSSTTQQVTVVNDAKLGSTIEVSGFTLLLSECVSCTDNNSIELKQGTFPQSANLVIDSVVTDAVNRYAAKLSIYLYTAYGFVSQPTIIRTGLDDVYVHVNATKEVYDSLLNSLAGNSSIPETFTVTVEKNSMINVVWVGVVMLFFGGFASLLSCTKAQKSFGVK